MKETLGQTLARLRQSAKPRLSLRKLGSALGVAGTSVLAWERDEATPTVENLQALGEFWGCTVDQLLSGDVLGADLPDTPPNIGDETLPKGYSEHSSTQVVRVKAVIRLSGAGAVQVSGVAEGVQLVRTDKLRRHGEFYALLVASSDNPVVRHGTAVIVSKSDPFKLDRLAVVTLNNSECLLMAPLVEHADAIKFERMDGSTVSLLRKDIQSVELVVDIDPDPQI